ncbi:MAG: histidine--tRNA ligase [Spirochaetia bacterium]|nr:histidine--tRNA ligase [Spirochaetia bacterium]MCF7946762.1 histidine--tRNA ligase [Spirochaetia bacterium]
MIIKPQILKGFRDALPGFEIKRKSLIHNLEKVFESFGFVPINTPVLEYTQVLLGKGGGETDKQVYSFQDHGKRDVSMRFDLTVPFARYMAQHNTELQLPFKRYHIDKVWRGENTQKGRFREFYQCDFDIVGLDNASSDFEIVLMMYSSLQRLGIPDFHIHLSHRGLFNTLLHSIGAHEKSAEILRIVDKLSKIGRSEIQKLLEEIIKPQQVQDIITFIEAKGDFLETLEKLEQLSGGNNEFTDRLRMIFTYAEQAGIAEKLVLNPSITRGLDYYTGIVFENFLDDLPGIGSICSGGRYNDLASLYTREKLPGVGASIGLDRLLAAMSELHTEKEKPSVTDVLICCMDEENIGSYHALAQKIRKEGLKTEVYLKKKKLQRQLQYAEKQGIPYVLLLGTEEISRGTYTLKCIENREQKTYENFESLISKILSEQE